MSPDLPEGRIYVLHSSATGPCPSLDWHIVVERNDVLARMVAWDNMRSMDRATGRVLVAQISFFLVIILSAMATGCCTMKPDCEGVWTATADVFPVVCWRVNYVNGQKANFLLRQGQTKQVKVRTGDTVSYWANDAPVPADRFVTPVCTD